MMNKTVRELKKILRASENSDNIEEMKMQIVKLEIQLKNAETEIERLRNDCRASAEELRDMRLRIAKQPTMYEYVAGLVAVLGTVIAILALK